MIGCFPDPYPDELLYSVCARFSDRVQYPSSKYALWELFGTTSATAIIDLPSHLSSLITALPTRHKYTDERLIDDHTLLPFYSLFLPPERVNHLRQDMAGENGLLAHMRSGIAGSCIHLPKLLRFCPLCVQEDEKQFGELYWHRLHQVPGVEVCPIHYVFLENSNARTQGRKRRYELVSASQAIQAVSAQTVDLSNPSHKALLRIAYDASWLLSQQGLVLGLESIRDRYLWLLAARNLANRDGKVRARQLLEAFQSYYPLDLLKQLQCVLKEQDQNNWLSRLVRSPKQAQHPLYHLLLIQFLGYTAEEFFQLPASPPAQSQPFGKEPWPCLNPTCKKFRQLCINGCHITYDKQRGRVTGTFCCTCGFSYSRLGPDRLESARYKIGKVKCYGLVWETALSNFWQDHTISVSEIAKQLGVDFQTVKSQALRLGLAFPRKGPTAKVTQLCENWQPAFRRVQTKKPNKLETYRQAWLEAVEENPEAGRTALQQQFRRIYSWLHVYDKEWLQAHLPNCKTRIKFSPQVDWLKRDTQLASAIRLSAQQLKSTLGYPVRITKTAIASAVGQQELIRKQKDKLPLSAKCLEELAETREEFAIRRIQWAEEYFRQENMYPKHWQFLRRAGIKPDFAEVPQVEEAIVSALQSLDLLSANHVNVPPSN